MATLCRIQFERPREILEKCCRNADLPPLLEPGVPGQTHPSQSRDLLTSKSRRASPAARRKPHFLGRNAFAAAAQEVRKLGPVSFEAAWRTHLVTLSNPLTPHLD